MVAQTVVLSNYETGEQLKEWIGHDREVTKVIWNKIWKNSNHTEILTQVMLQRLNTKPNRPKWLSRRFNQTLAFACEQHRIHFSWT